MRVRGLMDGGRRRAALAVVAAVAAGCGGGDGGGDAAATGVARIEAGGQVRTVAVAIADSAAERRRGLMGRESLAADAGMAFLFDEPATGGFWMKDTPLPLSIAFFAGDGRILRVFDMPPCRADPCPVYDPGVPYRGALEVARGSFARWGVGPGDTITVEE